MTKINTVAVLGTGVMGAQIAAHCANAGLKVFAFDMDQTISDKGIQDSLKIKPKAFYDKKNIDLIKACNYNDDLAKLNECDWIIEVIAERLEWKKDLYKKITPYIKGKILTSNTSGISLIELSEDMEIEIKKNFFITHFFNPPRYMKLVEFVYSNHNDSDIIKDMASFIENTLGKGVVYAKDTPNFIANRIGVYGMMVTVNEAINKKINIADVDALTGTLIGRPKSATFRTADVVGLDVMKFVADTAYNKCLNDVNREQYILPKQITKLIDDGCLGQKSGSGFYKKIDKGVIHALDLQTMNYEPIKKKRFKAISMAKEQNTLEGRLKASIFCDDEAGDFLWSITSKSFVYCAELLGEISDDIVNIDNAMCWGFAWEKGPFKMWDILGFNKVLNKMKESGLIIPEWVLNMKKNGFSSFYKLINGEHFYYDKESKNYKKIKLDSNRVSFSIYKNNNKTIYKDWSASMVDIGDGVLGVELHSVLKADFNPLDGSIISTLDKAVKWVKENNYKGIVISGDGPNFSAGANLNLILNAAYRKEWDLINIMTKTMQDTFQSLRFAPFPVVAAPYGFLIVYFLGRKGFCRFVCPWGAFLKVPTSLSMFKVRKTGECTNCNLCTESCPIGIDVSYEINSYEKVISSNCTSCMMCIDGCPESALSYKFMNPITEIDNMQLKDFKFSEQSYINKKIKRYFVSLRKQDILSMPFVIVFGVLLDGLYHFGHMLSFGIAAIIGITIFNHHFSKVLRKSLFIFALFFMIFNGYIKYSQNSAINYYKDKEYAKALPYFQNIVDYYPIKIGKYHAYLSSCYMQINDIDKSYLHYNKAKLI
ncbi:3-hydroxyacyl-CoA dehydrogenase NAD-binding domain-containing protein, partial [bacterium]|nr:3-hydroxyacyl-CoA dehydrogenase NAD-binding domain-containing protein [bacterium]